MLGNGVGIDFGTCFCRVAVVTGGQVELLERIPSRVACRGGRFVAGDKALAYAKSYLTNAVADISRLEVALETGLQVSRYDFSTMMFRHLKYCTEEHWDSIDEVMVGVPYSFDFKRRNILKEAATSAGLNVRRLVNEPTAAAVAYEHLHHAKNELALFVVMGGSSFDIAAIAIDKGVTVKAVSSDLSVGGEDFTTVLVKYCLSGIVAEVGVAAKQTLWRLCERAKKRLSSHRHVTIEADSFLPSVDLKIVLTRELMERLAVHLISRMEDALVEVKTALTSHRWKVQKAVLVGGSTNMPWIIRLVERLFGQVECLNVSSSYIAIGMAVLGASSIKMVDLLPCQVKFKTNPNFVYAEIPRYSILPAYIELEVELFKKQQTVRFGAYADATYDPLASISVTHHISDKTQTRTVIGSLSISDELEVSIHRVYPKKATFQTLTCSPYPTAGKSILTLLDVPTQEI